MNGFLVVLCHTMDDLPMGLFATRREATRFSEELPPDQSKQISKLFHANCSTPVCVRIVEFQEGIPISNSIVKTFDD